MKQHSQFEAGPATPLKRGQRSQGMIRRALLSCGTALLLASNGVGLLQAQDTFWQTGGSGNDWFLNSNWSSGIPTATNNAAISGPGYEAFIGGTNAAAANNLSLYQGKLTIGNTTTTGTLVLGGELSLSPTAASSTLLLNSGSISMNRFTIGEQGSFTDKSTTTLNFTGPNAGINLVDNLTLTLNSTITGTNGLAFSGPGTIRLGNTNTYTGGTSISSNTTVQVGLGGTSGTLGSGNVTNDGTLVFSRSDTITVSNSISGVGTVRQSGGGTMKVTTNNTYSGGTTISSGTVQVGDGGTTGSLGSGNITNSGVLSFYRTDNFTFTNLITGSGRLFQLGSGTMTITSDNTYSGITTITNGGKIQVGDGGTTGSLGTGSIANNGTLTYNRSDDFAVVNSISGTGNVVQSGTGTLTLTANNTYTGGTLINSNGTIQVGGGGQIQTGGNGGLTGTLGTGNITNNGTVIFYRNNTYSAANVISGSGRVVHAGTGTLTLTATNTYSGGTLVDNGGTLQLGHAQALGSGNLEILDGRLKADPNLTNGLAFSVGGDFVLGTNGVLELGIGGTQVASNQFDRLVAGGTANLDGTLHLTAFAGYRAKNGDSFELLVATNGLSGTFSDLTNDITHSDLLSANLVYGTNQLTLEWEHMLFTDFLASSNISLSANQSAVAGGLNALLSSTNASDVALIDALDYLSTGTNSLASALPGEFNKIAPEELSAMQVSSFTVMNAQGNQFLSHVRDLQSDYQRLYQATLGQRTRTKAEFDNYVNRPWDIYLELPFNNAKVDGDANGAGYDISANGVTIGGDGRVTENVIVGAALSMISSDASLENGGYVDLKSWAGQVYGTWFSPEGLHFEGMLGLGMNSYETRRASTGGVAAGDTSGFGFNMLLGGGYDWENGPWKFGPSASMQFMNSSIDGFTESGSDAPLHIDSQNESAFNGQLGVSLRYRHLVEDSFTIITPEVFVGYRHDFLDDTITIDSQFASGTSGFTVTGPELGSDSFLLSLGCNVQWKPEWNTYINYTLQRGQSGYDAGFLTLGLRYSF